MSASVLFDAPGPKGRVRQRILAVIGALVILAFIGFALWKMGEKGNLEAEKWTPFLTSSMWVDYLIPGLIKTLKAAAISIVLAGIFGLVFGMGRLSPNAALRWISTVVVEFFRSVPVLVMMIAAFSLYAFTLLQGNPELAPLAAVVTALTLYNGSVVAELLRSGVGSLPKGQAEAGLSVGLTPGQTLRSIQLPQAVTAMLPALVGQLVVVLKDTALGTIILYPELLTTFAQIGSNWSNPVPALIVIAIIYIVINYSLTTLASFIERRCAAWPDGARAATPPTSRPSPSTRVRPGCSTPSVPPPSRRVAPPTSRVALPGATRPGAWQRRRAAPGPGAALGQRCSPDWTRTNNLPVNSRLLCQLSYRGMLPGNHSKGFGPGAKSDRTGRADEPSETDL